MIGQISQPQRGAPGEGGAQAQLRHTTSSLAGYDAAVDAYAAGEAGPHVGDSATSVGGSAMPEFEDRQLLSARSRGPGSGGLLIGQSASLGAGRPVGAAMGAASPFEMGHMSQGALDRVNQARGCPGLSCGFRQCTVIDCAPPGSLRWNKHLWLGVSALQLRSALAQGARAV